ncbi:hypothetical protein GPECTOR_45g186 [Gonium pectorale]|uniref:NADH:ubiquinone reductase (non-electrogenic) n=1 Tax=Gonium pectorale TaxID=33097 RepID=A0A150G8Y0_GONPE|nr:hypothetical protein GPECTOR_45g186 [Gonium pectorale]|eukprot:KXZ46316.1 hypothetical protein GPECTOR_45g186 [Gonium pectorale]
MPAWTTGQRHTFHGSARATAAGPCGPSVRQSHPTAAAVSATFAIAPARPLLPAAAAASARRTAAAAPALRIRAQAPPFLGEEARPPARAAPGGPLRAPTLMPALRPLTATTSPAVPSAAPQPHRQPQGPFSKPGDHQQWPPKRAFAAVALDNLADSLTDIGRHLSRMAVEGECPQKRQEGMLVAGDSGRMRLRSSGKPVVLVLGSGWGAHSLIKVIDTDTYDVVVVSPRNHFVFTPMLPSTAVGTVEFRSLLEPIRTSNPCVTYLEAECEELDPQGKLAVCTPKFSFTDGRRPQFEVQYDKAVVAIGEQPATFGVPGVRENCFFMKEISDAVGLRKRIAEKFELASLPGTSEEDRNAALNFVVVGGGPTGVEFAGTLSDFLREDLRKKYPGLMKHVRVTLLQSAHTILTQFDAALQRIAAATLGRSGVEVRVDVRVVGVTTSKVLLAGGEELPYGVCLWSAGNAPRPLVSHIAHKIRDQAAAAEASRVPPGSKLCVDPFLRVVGATDLLALGDCSLVLGNRLPPTAQVAGQQGAYLAHLINSGYSLGVGGYSQPPPFQAVKRGALQSAMDRSALLRWLALAMVGGRDKVAVSAQVSDALFRMDAPPWVRAHSEALTAAPPLDGHGAPAAACDLGEVLAAVAAAGGADPAAAGRADRECLRAVAAEAEAEARRRAAEVEEVRYWDRPFEFLNLGIMAYLGHNRALTHVEAFDFINLNLHGTLAYALWRSVYITKQVSFRNRVLILFDWMKAKVFGRDISLW